MPCIAIKTNGHLCGRAGTQRMEEDIHPIHMELCSQHVQQYTRQYTRAGQTHHIAGRCMKFMTTNRWCPHEAANGGRLCATHEAANQRILNRRAEEQARELQAITIFRDQTTAHPLLDWQAGVRVIFNRTEFPLAIRHDAARRYYRFWRVADMDEPMWRHNRVEWRFAVYWRWLFEGANPAEMPDLTVPPFWANPPAIVIPLGHAQAGMAPPAPRAAAAQPELARIAADTQNVHTTAVTRQTNDMQKKLLEVVVQPFQQTEQAIVTEWLGILPQPRWSETLRTMNDIHKWFNTKSCRTMNDNLYRNMLRGVVAKIIETSDLSIRAELFKRLREECFESVGMCCEGHLSRLCNVFVGYDDAFKSLTTIGEEMQNKMAAIAGSDLPVEERLAQARAWFDEHAVPDAERQGWLAAIESM